jgi:hypothetical protein
MVSSRGDTETVACTRWPRDHDNGSATTSRWERGREFPYEEAQWDLNLFHLSTQASEQK